MKLSVYVPDELWSRALATAGGSHNKPSQLVQAALSQMVSAGRPVEASFGRTTMVDRARLAKIQTEKRAEAETLYQAGYDAGVSLAETWPWEVLDWASEREFDFDRIDENDWNEAEQLLARNLRDELFATATYEGRVFKLGRVSALRDVWDAVMSRDVADERDERPSAASVRSTEETR